MARRLPRSRLLALFLLFGYLTLQWTLLSSAGFHDGSANSARFHFDYLPSSSLDRVDKKGKDYVPIDLNNEIQKGLDYARSIKDTKRKLLFVHIPKVAGTTIEEVGGLQVKLAWGSCLFNHRPKRQGNVCRYPPGQFEWPTKIGYWHLPPQLFPLKGVNPYEGADLFAVVRDPFDRMLSEFYYICRRKKSKHWDYIDCNRTRLQEADYMNEWLQHKIEETPTGHFSPKDYLSYNGHFTPQSQFLVSYPAEIRMIDYVLRIDNLEPEFNALMNVFEISAEMLAHKKNAARNDTLDLEVVHLNAKTLGLLHERYGHDIDILNNRKLG